MGARGIPAHYGGFETFAEQLAVRLVERGHEVTVFCEKGEETSEEYRGVKLRHVAARGLGPLTTVVYDAACLWKARREFDVIYMLGYGSSAFCWIPRIWGAEVWINMDGLEWARGKWGRLARMYFHFAEAIAMWTPDRIIADAAAIKANLESRYRKMPPCDVIPYGCEIVKDARGEELSEFGLEPGSYYLVVCRFEPENLVREIVEGFLAARTNARLVLVGGNGARKSPYAESLSDYKSERLLFTGPVYEKPKIHALRYFCRAYLHGHSVGGTNPSLLEAMGCGNVVIAHDNPFNREVLGGAGLFFADPEALKRCIERVESGEARAREMKIEVVERVKQFYTWERITDCYCELLAMVDSKMSGTGETVHHAPLYQASPVQIDRTK